MLYLDTCKVPNKMTVVTKDCNDFYSWSNEDTDHYTVNWQPVQNTTQTPTASWSYYTSDELNTYPFAG